MSFLTVIENAFSPAIQEAVTFAHMLEQDVENTENTDIAGAFTAAYTTYESATGTLEEKAIAALEAFGKVLLGDAVTVTIAAAGQAAGNPTGTSS